VSDRRLTLSLEELQLSCTLLERACVNEQRLTEVEVDARRPGSTQVVDDGCPSWLTYHGWLSRKHVGGGAASPAPTLVETALAPSPAHALQQMLSNEPVRVTLDLDRKSAEPKYPDGKVVHVHPKSPTALRWLDSLNAQCLRMACAAKQAAALETIADDRVLALVPLGLSLAERLWASVLTHPGALLPFDPNAPSNPEPDEWTAALSESDYVNLYLAHRQVHEVRQRMASGAFGANGDGATIVPLDGLLAAFTKESGGRPSEVLSSWTLGEIAGQAISEAQLHREAMARADRTRDRST
jgi:hypothetical protein